MIDENDWLEGLAGRGHGAKDKGLLEIRRSLARKHEAALNKIHIDEEEIRNTLSMLSSAGLIGKRLEDKSFNIRAFEWIKAYSSPRLIGVAATLMLTIGVVAKFTLNNITLNNEIAENSFIVMRGNETISELRPLLSNNPIEGSLYQVVDSVQLSAAEWEADLIGSGIPYKIIELAPSENKIYIHLLLDQNTIDHLSDKHKRALEGNATRGEFVLVIQGNSSHANPSHDGLNVPELK